MRLDAETAKAVYSLRGSANESFKKLIRFFEEKAATAVRDAANSTGNTLLQNQMLGQWQVWDALARIEDAAETTKNAGIA